MKPFFGVFVEAALQILETQRDLGLEMSLQHRDIDEEVRV
jgi:hypothetical protein